MGMSPSYCLAYRECMAPIKQRWSCKRECSQVLLQLAVILNREMLVRRLITASAVVTECMSGESMTEPTVPRNFVDHVSVLSFRVARYQ